MSQLPVGDDCNNCAAPLRSRRLLSSQRGRRRGPRSWDAYVRRLTKSRGHPPGEACGPSHALTPDLDQIEAHNIDNNSQRIQSNGIESGITIMSINIRSLIKNKIALYDFLEQHTLNLVCMQETWLDDSIELFDIPNYQYVSRRDRDMDPHGCVFFCVFFYTTPHRQRTAAREMKTKLRDLDLPT